ncbi:unnamed protein product [Rotaria magnacalcarata]|uniref:F-box domain-containing protein n=1 Tax=Rotaria magnacalcarata TaxID=392030 RepID=A0A816X6Q0_9BILA|nr:unnamed protein product [Rotaria magnacalcarata]
MPFFLGLPDTTIESIVRNLTCFKMLKVSQSDEVTINKFYTNMEKLEHLHLTILYTTEFSPRGNRLFRLQSSGKRRALRPVTIRKPNGFILRKALAAHEGLQYVDLVLKMIDDLFVLLGGLVPNVQTMIIKLQQSRLLISRYPRWTSSCSHLIEFTLVDDVTSMLIYISVLLKLTLSTRDTPDHRFCHGLTMDSVLTQYAVHLQKFHYTMMHRISDQTLVESFTQWSMNVVFYENENVNWVHIFHYHGGVTTKTSVNYLMCRMNPIGQSHRILNKPNT